MLETASVFWMAQRLVMRSFAEFGYKLHIWLLWPRVAECLTDPAGTSGLDPGLWWSVAGVALEDYRNLPCTRQLD